MTRQIRARFRALAIVTLLILFFVAALPGEYLTRIRAGDAEGLSVRDLGQCTETGGLGVVSAGLGLDNTSAGAADPTDPSEPLHGTFTVSGIPAGAVVEEAWLYWNGSDAGNTPEDDPALFDPNFHDGDPTILLAGVQPASVGRVGGPVFASVSDFSYSHRADVSGIVTGNGSYTLSGIDSLDNFANGAELVVIYRDLTQPPAYLGHVEGLDLSKGASAGLSTVFFTFAPAAINRTADLRLFLGGAGFESAVHSLWLLGGDDASPLKPVASMASDVDIIGEAGATEISDPFSGFNNQNGDGYWDSYQLADIPIPAGNTWFAFQIESAVLSLPEARLELVGATLSDMALACPQISITKTRASPDNVLPGEPVVFDIVLQNIGITDLVTVTLQDTYDPAHLSYNPASTTPPADSAADDGILDWATGVGFGPLPMGSAPITITAAFVGVADTVDLQDGRTLNTATVWARTAAGEMIGPETDADHVTILDPLGSIGDFVWDDRDGDAIQDLGEPGIPNVVVKLENSAGIVITDTTDANGNYGFFDLPAGAYTVTVDTTTLPPQFNLITTANPQTVDLAINEDYENADFGFKASAIVVGDFIWYDSNADGIQNVGEPGLGNVSLRLYFDNGDHIYNPTLDFLVDSTVSDIFGAYRLDAPVPGEYFVDVIDDNGVLTGYYHTIGPQSIADPSPPILLDYGDLYRDADFGYVRVPGPGNALIGDLVWVDVNSNAIRESFEPVLIDVLVCATPVGGGIAACDTTDLNGRYLIEVPAGSYNVAPTAPPFGLTPTTPVPHTVTVMAGEQYLDADFGYTGGDDILGSIGGTIWKDLPDNDIANGIYEPPLEPGISSVSVNLIRDVGSDGVWDVGDPIIAVLSDLSGNYLFKGLLPGDYLLRVTDTLDRLRYFKVSALGPNPGQDNNNQAQPYAINLSEGAMNTTADFGYREFEVTGGGDDPDPGLIGDLVWEDNDGDGLFNPIAGDIGIAGVTLEVWSNGSPVANTTTGGYGMYLFTDLPLDDYEVRVTDVFGVLDGYRPSAPGPNPGQNDNNQAQPYPVTLNLIETNLTADFGYVRPAAIGDFVYIDFNGNGAQDIGEDIGVGDVPITLTNLSTLEVITTFSSNGDYAFTNLLPGSYRVEAPHSIGILLRSSASPLEVSVIAGQIYTDADFGFVLPTAVQLTSFTASSLQRGTELSWTTSAEKDLDGFIVLRASASDGVFRAVSPLIPAKNFSDGFSYAWIDESASPEMSFWYKLQVLPGGELFGPIPTESALHFRIFLPTLSH
ncbi:MAG: hypothetical protein J5I90_15860 [Caldilineales bacterium]|nr:hypothetical protein [Caldilineales bacterium]